MAGGYPPIKGSLPSDFILEVAKGNVPGHSLRGSVSVNDAVTTTFVDVWGGVGDLIYPTANETWEIVSLSPNDTLLGSGARKVLVNYLDEDYKQQSTLAEMNGTTAVTLNADHFRPDGAVVVDSGSSKGNAGRISIRNASGASERQVIPIIAVTGKGANTSLDTHFTVPAGKTAFSLKLTPFFPKNQDGHLGSSLELVGTNTLLTPGTLPFYQNAFDVTFEAPFEIPEKTDVKVGVISTNVGPITVSVIYEALIVDNII